MFLDAKPFIEEKKQDVTAKEKAGRKNGETHDYCLMSRGTCFGEMVVELWLGYV